MRADTLAPRPNRFHPPFVPSAKALLFCPNAIDSEWLAAEFVRRGWDAEAVVSTAAFDRAVQWWKPDVVLVASTVGSAAAAAAVSLAKQQEAPPLVFLFGTRPPLLIEKVSAACRADFGFSTLGDFLPLVDAACQAHSDRIRQSLDGESGFASPADVDVAHGKP